MIITKLNAYKSILIVGLVVLLGIGAYRYLKPNYEYMIVDSKPAIQASISEALGSPVQIKVISEVDNKKVVVFSIGSEVGDSEFTKGPNDKLKFESAGHGTNTIRYSIMNTNKGQYVRFLGKNENNVKKILTFVDDEKYEVTIPQGDFFITWIALNKSTESNFPSGSVWYDDEDHEIARIGISKDTIL